MNAFAAALLAFVAEGGGVLTGILLLYFFHIKSKRLIGMLFGTTSGIMIAMICFDVLPHALEAGENTLMIIGVLMGILIGVFLEDFTELLGDRLGTTYNKRIHTGLILLLGIAIHNIPEGVALGTLAATSPQTILKFALVIGLHSIPEAIAVAIPLKIAKTPYKTIAMIPFVLGGIMAIGALGGFVMSQVASFLITVMLGLAAGIILYIVCQELLPESRKIWNGRLTTIATVIGIIIGMLLVK